MSRTLGPRGMALLKAIEKLELRAYQDQGGVWTIGYGHTPSYEGEEIGPNKAEALLIEDLREPIGVFADNDALTQSQFDALVSFTYNVGVHALLGSTLLRRIEGRQWFDAAREFLRWTKVKGQDSRGLMRRRLAEAALFCEDQWTE